MTPARQRELECTDTKLTREEWREGYHFCPEFDYLCTQGEVFSDDDERICLCGFDRRNVDLYLVERLVSNLTVKTLEEALEEMFEEKK